MAKSPAKNDNGDSQGWPDRLKRIWNRFTRNQLVFLSLALLATIALWLVGDFFEQRDNKILAEAFKQITIFWVSLSVFDSLKEFWLHRDYEDDRRKLLDEATTRFDRIMDIDKDIHARGIRRLRDSFSLAELKVLIQGLEDGDCLYCHDGSISDFSRLKETIKNKAKAGVNFKFISLAPFCKNAVRRAYEMNEEAAFYSSACLQFARCIESIQNELVAEVPKENLEGQNIKDKVQFKLYRSLMNIPFYLVVRKTKPSFAVTGFYLTRPSSSLIHIEWEGTSLQQISSFVDGREIVSSSIAEPNTFISELWDYWNFKWDKGCKEYDQSKKLEGFWEYTSYADNDVPVYTGTCTILEETGSLRASGIREFTYIEDNKPTPTRIEWKTDVMHKYIDGDDLCLITSHSCYPQSGVLAKIGVTAFMKLALKTEDKLVGQYFVTGQVGDPLFQARSGRVEFTRAALRDESEGK